MPALADFASTIEFTPASFQGLSQHLDVEWIEKALRAPASLYFCGICCGGGCLNPRCPGSKLRRTLQTHPGYERRIAEIAVRDYGA